MSLCYYGLQCGNIKLTFGEKRRCIYIFFTIMLMRLKKYHSIAPSNNTPRDAFTENSF
jgi:hypothetical protein